jgi:hypothetical protein
MRFKSPQKPQLGDVRHRSGFLWLPASCQGEARWLERAEWTEEFIPREGGWRPRLWGHHPAKSPGTWLGGRGRMPTSPPV